MHIKAQGFHEFRVKTEEKMESSEVERGEKSQPGLGE